MKLSKKELMQRISDLIEDDTTKISVLEDLEDSIIEEGTVQDVVDETTKRELEDLKWKYEDLVQRYKDRFLKGDDKKDAEDKKEEVDEELEEKEVIDIKEI